MFSLQIEVYFINAIKYSNISKIKEITPEATINTKGEKITVAVCGRSKINALK